MAVGLETVTLFLSGHTLCSRVAMLGVGKRIAEPSKFSFQEMYSMYAYL